MRTGRPRRTMAEVKEHFWEWVDCTPGLGPSGDCWEWRGSTSSSYGTIKLFFNDKKKQMGAHKASHLLFKGPVPAGKIVMHSCDNKICVRPDHLSVGTHKENKIDSMHKRRHARNELHGRAKLSDAQVRQLRHEYAALPRTKSGTLQRGALITLAKKYGVTKVTAMMIAKRTQRTNTI